jgi:hypothetical protein
MWNKSGDTTLKKEYFNFINLIKQTSDDETETDRTELVIVFDIYYSVLAIEGKEEQKKNNSLNDQPHIREYCRTIDTIFRKDNYFLIRKVLEFFVCENGLTFTNLSQDYYTPENDNVTKKDIAIGVINFMSNPLGIPYPRAIINKLENQFYYCVIVDKVHNSVKLDTINCSMENFNSDDPTIRRKIVKLSDLEDDFFKYETSENKN